MKQLVLTALVFCLSLNVIAQEIYQTKKGTLAIIASTPETTIFAHSKQLEIRLDYKTAEIIAQLPLSSLHTGIDSLDIFFQSAKSSFVLLEGKLGIEYINTQAHPVQNFKFRANLNYGDKITEVLGEGQLQHIDGGESVACLLGLSFTIDPDIFELNQLLSWNKEQLKIQIIQSVLNQSDVNDF